MKADSVQQPCAVTFTNVCGILAVSDNFFGVIIFDEGNVDESPSNHRGDGGIFARTPFEIHVRVTTKPVWRL